MPWNTKAMYWERLKLGTNHLLDQKKINKTVFFSNTVENRNFVENRNSPIKNVDAVSSIYA